MKVRYIIEFELDQENLKEEICVPKTIPIFTYFNELYGEEIVKKIIKRYEEEARAYDKIAALEKEIAELKK